MSEIKVFIKYDVGVSNLLGVEEEVFNLSEGATLEDLLDMVQGKYDDKDFDLSSGFYTVYDASKKFIYDMGKAREYALSDGDLIEFMIINVHGG